MDRVRDDSYIGGSPPMTPTTPLPTDAETPSDEELIAQFCKSLNDPEARLMSEGKHWWNNWGDRTKQLLLKRLSPQVGEDVIAAAIEKYNEVWQVAEGIDAHSAVRRKAMTAALSAARLLSSPREDEMRLGKRPVAFRVKDLADDWILFHDEEAANREAEHTGAIMQGLYVRDGTPMVSPLSREVELQEALELCKKLSSRDGPPSSIEACREIEGICHKALASTPSSPAVVCDDCGKNLLDETEPHQTDCRNIGTDAAKVEAMRNEYLPCTCCDGSGKTTDVMHRVIDCMFCRGTGEYHLNGFPISRQPIDPKSPVVDREALRAEIKREVLDAMLIETSHMTQMQKAHAREDRAWSSAGKIASLLAPAGTADAEAGK